MSNIETITSLLLDCMNHSHCDSFLACEMSDKNQQLKSQQAIVTSRQTQEPHLKQPTP